MSYPAPCGDGQLVKRGLAAFFAVGALALALWWAFRSPPDRPRGSAKAADNAALADVDKKSSVTRSAAPSAEPHQGGPDQADPDEGGAARVTRDASLVDPAGLPSSVRQQARQLLSQQMDYFDDKANKPAGSEESIRDYVDRVSAMCESRKRRLAIGLITGELEVRGALFLASTDRSPRSLSPDGPWLALGGPWKVSPGAVDGHWELNPVDGEERRLVVAIEMDKELEALRETYLNAERAWVGEVCAELNALPARERELEIDRRSLRANARFTVGGDGLLYPAESR